MLGMKVMVPMLGVLVVVSGFIRQTSAAAQSAVFEAASVRANNSSDGRISGGTRGRIYTAVNMPARMIISSAYGLQLQGRLEGGPGWVRSERFDITATLPAGASVRQVPEMLRALLAERFKLVVRKEVEQAPGYALVLARQDGRLGPGLRRAALDCVSEDAAGRDIPAPKPGEDPPCQSQVDDAIRGRGQPLSTLARLLQVFVKRPVVDRTGVTGGFDFDLLIPVQTTAVATDAGGGIFTALQEEFGLRLESTTLPIDIVTIERIERPTEN
jgi:uncharacterized protein (TIGR03435 family)